MAIRFLFPLVLLGFSFGYQIAQAQSVPKLINYQGKLTNAEGSGLSGEYELEFRLFDAPAEGALVWGEKRTVTVVAGVFNVALGGAGSQPVDGAAVNDIGFAFGAAGRYLETRILAGPGIAAEQILAPRQQMASAPFALSALHGVPAGTVVPFAGAAIPEGWVLCDARILDASDARYKALHAAIGSTYNTGGELTGFFRLPDMRGRTAIGTGQGDTWSGIGGATNWLLGQKFGAERHQMSIAEMPSHNHGVNDPGHSHLMTVSAFIHGNFHATNQGSLSQTNINGHSPRTEHVTTGISIQNRGNDQPHNNMQPSLVLNYIIKL